VLDMRAPTLEERLRYTYKLCKCGKEYNVSKYHVGPYKCYGCEAKERRKKK